MIKAPYQIQLEDLPVTVEYLHIDMPHFVEPLAEFNEDMWDNMLLHGKWHSRELRNAADFTVTILFGTNDNNKYSDLTFTGRFSINRYGGFEPAYLAERVGKYCYRLIENYVEQKTIIDKNKVLYPVPEFKYFEDTWKKLYFDLPY